MDNQLVRFSSPAVTAFDDSQQTVTAMSSPLAAISGVGNTPALMPQNDADPLPGTSWMSEAPLMTEPEAGPPLPDAFERSLTWVQSLPGPSHRPPYNPLEAMASMAETFSLESSAGVRRFSWRSAAEPALPATARHYATSAEHIASLAESMVAESQPDTLLNAGGMLAASIRLRRMVAGNRKQVRVVVPRNCRLPMVNTAAVFETLHGWGLFRINSDDATGSAAQHEARQDNLLMIRKKISERVMKGIYRKRLNPHSPVSRQQQEFAGIVREVYEEEMTQALERLNIAVPPGIDFSGWCRLTARSTRAVVDETEPTDTTPQFTLNVQCGEQVALTYALLVHQKPRPVPAEQLRMMTFNGAEDNHSVVLYACSPACQFGDLIAGSGDARAPIPVDRFVTWLFNQRRNVLILDPAAEDSRVNKPVEEVKHNAFQTNKCIAFYNCHAAQQIEEGVTSLLHQAGIGLDDISVTIDHPLAEVKESALENATPDTASEGESSVWDDSLYDTETESSRGGEFSAA